MTVEGSGLTLFTRCSRGQIQSRLLNAKYRKSDPAVISAGPEAVIALEARNASMAGLLLGSVVGRNIACCRTARDQASDGAAVMPKQKGHPQMLRPCHRPASASSSPFRIRSSPYSNSSS